VLAVNVLPDAGGLRELEAFWRSRGGGDVVFAEDTRREALTAFQIRVAGTKVIVDRKGRVAFRETSVMSYEKLRSAAEQAL